MPCPAPIPGFVPRTIHSPSALSKDRECRASWGRAYLEGRREAQPAYADLPAPPAKLHKGASAVAKAKHKAELKAYNRVMRPAQGTAAHEVLGAYFLQKTEGAWHPPMAWLDLAEAWHTRPGQIALSGLEHLPKPAELAAVWVEEMVWLEPVHSDDCGLGLGGPCDCAAAYWPPMGGTPDLVTEVGHWNRDAGPLLHLYDYKTTISFEYAKTPAELLEDEQAAMYSLAVMQRHGLRSLDCTWVYFRTDDKLSPASLPVHFTMTRAHAEEIVLRLAAQAAELEAIQQAYLAERPGMLGKRLQIIQALPTNDLACDNFRSRCCFHYTQSGPCKPAKTPMGVALEATAARHAKTTARREAAKQATKTTKAGINMALTAEQKTRLAEVVKLLETKPTDFKLKQEKLKLERLAAADPEPPAEDPPTRDESIDTTGEDVKDEPEAPADKPTPAKPKAKPGKAAPAPADGIHATVDGFAFEVPAGSALAKALAKAAKGLQAAAAAFEGE